MDFDIFVSYSSKDKVIADAIITALEGKKIRCWYAPRDIKPGAMWADSIIEAIQGCQLVLLIFSSNSNRSTQVLDEISYAISEEKVIMPFRVENLDPSGALRLHLSSRHWLNAYDPSWEEHINDLIKGIAVNLGIEIDLTEEPVPEPAPEEDEVENDHEVELHEPQTILSGLTLEKKKKPPWLWIGITSVLAVILIFVLGIVFGSMFQAEGQSVATGETRQPTSVEVFETEEVIEPTFTSEASIIPTATSEPEKMDATESELNKAEIFSAPIFKYSVNNPPDFEEEFSEAKDYWQEGSNTGDFVLNDFILDGVLHFNLDAESLGYDALDIQYDWQMIQGEEIRFQIDFRVSDIDQDQMIQIFRFDPIAEVGSILCLDLKDQSWSLSRYQDEEEEPFFFETGDIDTKVDEFSTVMLINFDGQSAIYLDNELLAYYETEMLSGSNLAFGPTSSDQIKVDFDNIKLWNLDAVTFFDVEDNPFMYIFDYASRTQPSFSEDFPTHQVYWEVSEIINRDGNGDTLVEYVNDGVLRLFANADDVETILDFGLNLNTIQGNDIILMFDFIPNEIAEGSNTGVQIHKNDNGESIFRISMGGEYLWEAVENDMNGEEIRVVSEGRCEPLIGMNNTLLMVSYQGSSGIFLNGELLDTFEQPMFSGAGISFGALSNGSINIDLDNIRFWDLEEVQLSP